MPTPIETRGCANIEAPANSAIPIPIHFVFIKLPSFHPALMHTPGQSPSAFDCAGSGGWEVEAGGGAPAPRWFWADYVSEALPLVFYRRFFDVVDQHFDGH